MKKCTHCKTDKEDSEFSKNQCWCKECSKIACHEYYVKNKENVLIKQKEYRQTPEGKLVSYNSQTKYQQSERGREVVNTANRRYRATPHGKLVYRAAVKRCKIRAKELDYVYDEECEDITDGLTEEEYEFLNIYKQ